MLRVTLSAILCITALVAGCHASDDEPDGEQWTAGGARLSINGNCNGVGTNVNVTCYPARDARVDITQSKLDFVWFDGTPDQLPTPPDYENRAYPCGDWSDWLSRTPGMYLSGPAFDIGMFGPPGTVTLTRVVASIFDRPKRDREGTWIQCQWGGGNNIPFLITVDTRSSRTTLTVSEQTESEDDKTSPMPPAIVALDEDGNTTGTVLIRSNEGYLYSGGVTFTADLNGAAWVYEVGSEENPLRWIEDGPSGDLGTRYMWDRRSRTWRPGFNPMEGT